MRMTPKVVALVLGAWMSAGCGDDGSASRGETEGAGETSTSAGTGESGESESSGGDFSDLPADKPWSAMSEAERAQLCADIEAALLKGGVDAEVATRATCIRDGHGAGFMDPENMPEALCQAQFDDCIAGGPSLGTPLDALCDLDGFTDACTFTVADMEACTTKRIAGLLEMQPLTCADVDFDAPDVPGLLEAISCFSLAQTCF